MPLNADNTFPLPTHANLGVDPALIKPDIDPKPIVQQWLDEFRTHVSNNDVKGVVGLLVQQSYWRDILALTWNFRTFAGSWKIQTFLTDRLAHSNITNIMLQDQSVALSTLVPGLSWIQFTFTFETGNVGSGLGIVRLVPTPSTQQQERLVWKAHVVATFLQNLQSFPEKLGAHRNTECYAGKTVWGDERQKEVAAYEAESHNPTVLVIGGAQAGLDVAARLKMLGVDTLVVEKGDRIGGNWIERYKSLKLHDPIWYDHLPYLPFPSSFPAFIPSGKLANWLQYYAEAMELNVWLSSTATNITRDPQTGLWKVTVVRRVLNQPESTRVFIVKHAIFAIGLVSQEPVIPSFPNLETFKGELLHAFRFKSAEKYKGKKVIVVGACTSAHDISSDLYHNGADVTMLQRSPTYVTSMANGLKVIFGGLYDEGGPPTELADHIQASFPIAMSIPLFQMRIQLLAQLDNDLLEGLKRRGFKTTLGINDTGFVLLGYEKNGGYYIETGTSKLIIDGHIAVSSSSPIKQFIANGIELESGETLEADAVIFATGVGDLNTAVRSLVSPPSLASRMPLIWGLNDEGEVNGVYRDGDGSEGLWYMFGNLAACRFHSKHVALQIKAKEEGLFAGRYTD